jgi:hypothetical protein
MEQMEETIKPQKRASDSYQIEREYGNEISCQECLLQIIKAHLEFESIGAKDE